MDPSHPLHATASAPDPERRMKITTFDTSYVTTVHGCVNEGDEKKERLRNRKRIHTDIVTRHLAEIPVHPLINIKPPDIHKSERNLSRKTRRTLAQLRAQKSPMLKEYLHNIGKEDDPMCPLCRQTAHNTSHIFQCESVPTDLTPVDLWRRPVRVAELLQEWQTALATAEN